MFQNNAWNTNMSPTSWHFWVDDFPFPKVDILVPWRVSPEFFTKNIPQKKHIGQQSMPMHTMCFLCKQVAFGEKKRNYTTWKADG